MSEKNLTNYKNSSAQMREGTRPKDHFISPAVDILENQEGLTIVADMPGLDEDSLEVTIEQDVLTIKGNAPAGSGDFQYREFAMAGYWRQFLLSDSFDAEKANASIKQGVMTLTIPKAESAKPKRIEVTVH